MAHDEYYNMGKDVPHETYEFRHTTNTKRNEEFLRKNKYLSTIT